MTRTGAAYLALELRDRSGTIPARAFRDADVLAGRFERGDLVRVVGRVERFRDELVLEVERRRARRRRGRPGRLPAHRLPRPRRARRLPRAPGRRGLRPRLPRAARFAARRSRCSARRCAARRRTRSGHHAYLGGLLEHTVAVATLAHETVPAAPAAELGPAADRGPRPRHRPDARVHLRRRDRAHRRGPPARPPPDRPAHARRARPAASTRSAASRCCTASSATTAPDPRPAGGSARAEAVALYRLNALDASVKGALEHGLGS